MSALIRQNVLTPVLPEKDQIKIHWSRLYGSAKSLAIASMLEKIKNPIVVITTDVLTKPFLTYKREKYVSVMAIYLL